MTADVAEQLVRAGEAALAHPEFAQERLHLGATIEAIDGWMQRPLKQATGTGDEDALLAMERYRAWRRIQLREALQSSLRHWRVLLESGPHVHLSLLPAA